MRTERQCPHCDQQFTRTEHLLRHVRTHTKEKPFKCVVCSRTYTREDTLIRHTKSHLPSRVGQETGFTGPPEYHESAQALSPQGSHNGTAHSGQTRSPRSDETRTRNESSQFLPDDNGYMPSLDDLTALGLAGTPPMQVLIDSSSRAWDMWSMPFSEQFQASLLSGDFPGKLMDTVPEQVGGRDMRTQDVGALVQGQTSEMPSPSDLNLPPPIHSVERMWFTKMRADDSHTVPSSTSIAQATTPNTQYGEHIDVDDQYRLQLSKAVLTPQPHDEPLPSSDFLNLCMHMYFTRFSPLFPIVHGATFQPTAENQLLLLSMTSIGCLFLGSPAAAQRGRHIFKRLNKAILASWEKVIVQSNDEPLAMLQASVLGQLFALLSGDPEDIALCEAFHGSTITLARRGKIFGRRAAILEVQDMTAAGLQATWRSWVRREVTNRVCAALRIQDAELCAISHLQPLLSQGVSETPQLSSMRVFSASTAAEWASIVHSEAIASEPIRVNPLSERSVSLTAYVILEGIATSIAEARRHGHADNATFNSHHESLITWFNTYGKLSNVEQPDKLSLTMLWHWVNMSMLVDFDKLECAIGRDGSEAAPPAIEYVASWVSSPNSLRCTLHAFLAQRQMQSLPSNSIPAIHVPRILFSAAILWYCFMQYGTIEGLARALSEDPCAQFPELAILSSAAKRHLSEITQRYKSGSVISIKAMTLCELADSLQHITHWGIAEKFAAIVACLIYRDPKDNS